MKLFFLLSAFVFLLNSIVVAQKRKTYTINPGEKATEVIPADEIFLYPNFTPGTVYYKTGPYSSGLLNYNFLIAEIQFIDPKGDTLSLADEITIDYIAFTRDTFYYDNGYLKFIRNCGKFKLAQKQFFSIANKEKIGAMGIKTSSSSIDTYTRLPGNNRFKSNGLVAQEVLTLARNDLYYFGDKFNHFKRLNKKNLIEAYPAKGKEIRDYFKENSLKKITEEDMVKLMESLSEKK
jgi:hypothetical protein